MKITLKIFVKSLCSELKLSFLFTFALLNYFAFSSGDIGSSTSSYAELAVLVEYRS